MVEFGLHEKRKKINYTGKKQHIHTTDVFFYSHLRNKKKLFLSLFNFFFYASLPCRYQPLKFKLNKPFHWQTKDTILFLTYGVLNQYENTHYWRRWP
ncbi:hypothetical protein TPSD3_15120 [Thioflexithrix psekupsensis]|uniref:Uncharacterized protein n=1 Tax=Thioflexithrix psekupsensis TaxID=1570016 RepID=A0A251X678_9GAMM|nr:hypothetical protein TPSD3_15120 [Thioflexithrix psekupsensis]